MKNPLKVKFVSFSEASSEIFLEAEAKFRSQCSNLQFEKSEHNPDLIYFISGGSELEAIKALDKSSSTLLVAGAANNAWAAATEVKAFANQKGFETHLVSADDPDLEHQLVQYQKITSAFNEIKGQRLGLIGSVSDWLVASSITADRLKNVFGVELLQLAYENLNDYLSYSPDVQIKEVFPNLNGDYVKLGSVSSFLKDLIAQNQLDAITIQCFRMVKEKGVTACLPVALLNNIGIPAGCEGDLVSIVSKMFVKALTGDIPWMANMVAVKESHILLAHCTIPLQLTKTFEINTHFETNQSAAIQAQIEMEDLTILRMNNELNTAFVAEGKVIGRPNYPNACRTQLEVALLPDDLFKLKSNPLGNHHIVIPGRNGNLIKAALKAKNFTII